MLRPLAAADLEGLAALANDREVAEKTARMPYPYELADARAWFDGLKGSPDQPGERAFAVLRRSDEVLLGVVGLMPREERRTVEVGFWLGRPFWGRGYMTEALARMLRYAFEELGLEVVRAGAFPDNPASLRVQEKVGMSRIGREMQAAPARGGDKEVVVTKIRREDWLR